jgi:hypothetical protein
MTESRPPLTAPSAGANVHVHGTSVILLPSCIPLTMNAAAAEALAERLRAAAQEASRAEVANGRS